MLQTFERFAAPPGIELPRAEEPIADKSIDRVVLSVGDFDDLARQRER